MELGLSGSDWVALLEALEDAYHYRVGEASGLDDPDLDPDDRARAVVYDALLGRLATATATHLLGGEP